MKKYYFNQNEVIYDNKGHFYNPHYSTKETDKYFEILLEDFIKSKYFKKVEFGKINCVSIILQDLFWQYSFNCIKYKELIQKLGKLDVQFIKSPKNMDNYSNGYEKLKKFESGFKLFSLKNIFTFFNGFINRFFSKINILIFIFINLFRNNKNKVWIFPDLIYHNNFDLGEIKNYKNVLILNQNLFYHSINKFKFSVKNLNHSLYLEVNKRLSNYKLWILAIKLLKPKKIILQDNLFNDWSIFLASKQLRIPTVGVTHGMISKYHKNIIGSDFLKNVEILKFDKIFIWCEEFKNEADYNSKIYQKDEIFLSGWISNKDVKKKQLNLDNSLDKYVLHAYEINSNFLEIEKIMNFFYKKNYQIILKKRFPFNDYFQFSKINNLVVVDNFSKDHIDNALCSICNASTYVMNYKAMNIPIVIPEKDYDGYNFFHENKLNIFYFSQDIEKKIKNAKLYNYDFPEITEKFKKEFN